MRRQLDEGRNWYPHRCLDVLCLRDLLLLQPRGDVCVCTACGRRVFPDTHWPDPLPSLCLTGSRKTGLRA
eukprot:3829311-Alexandrium_andersonii.AAC.1